MLRGGGAAQPARSPLQVAKGHAMPPDDPQSALARTAPAADPEAAAAAARRAAEQAAGAGTADVAYAIEPSPLGDLLVATTPRGLVSLHYEDGQLDALLDRLAERLSPRVVQAPGRLDGVRRELDEYFAGERRRFQAPLDRPPPPRLSRPPAPT